MSKVRHKWIGIALSIVFSLVLTACEQPDVTIRLLVYDWAADTYMFKDVEVRTLTDVNTLQGRATNIYGGAELTLNYVQNHLKWQDNGHDIAFSAIDKGGVLIPEDYDSLAMASIYYNIESARFFFIETLGLQIDVVGSLPTYYWASLTIVDQLGRETTLLDNAFYMFMTEKRAFFVMPFEQFQWIPMSLNVGIMTHEYTHAVFDVLVLGLSGDGFLSDSGANFLYGLNEGCADFMAVAFTGDPNFMRHSIAEGLYGAECNQSGVATDIVRDASVNIDYTRQMDRAARNIDKNDFCPYDIGSFWASLLYEIAKEIDTQGNEYVSEAAIQKVAYWLAGTMGALGDRLESDFELYDALSLFISQILDTTDVDDACTVINRRYNMYYSEVKGC